MALFRDPRPHNLPVPHHPQTPGQPRTARHPVRRILIMSAALLLVSATAATTSAMAQQAPPSFEVQSLDGSGNNRRQPDLGQAGTTYSRVAAGPLRRRPQPARRRAELPHRQQPRSSTTPTRTCSPSASVTQWGFVVGPVPRPHLRPALGDAPATRGEPRTSRSTPTTRWRSSPTPSASSRSPAPAAAPGTGVTNARQQVNTVSSYIDAWAVYGGTDSERLEWLREGPVDGNLANNSARLLLPGRATAPARRARQRRHRAADGHRRPAAGQRRTGPWSPATCAPTRTSR